MFTLCWKWQEMLWATRRASVLSTDWKRGCFKWAWHLNKITMGTIKQNRLLREVMKFPSMKILRSNRTKPRATLSDLRAHPAARRRLKGDLLQCSFNLNDCGCKEENPLLEPPGSQKFPLRTPGEARWVKAFLLLTDIVRTHSSHVTYFQHQIWTLKLKIHCNWTEILTLEMLIREVCQTSGEIHGRRFYYWKINCSINLDIKWCLEVCKSLPK